MNWVFGVQMQSIVAMGGLSKTTFYALVLFIRLTARRSVAMRMYSSEYLSTRLSAWVGNVALCVGAILLSALPVHVVNGQDTRLKEFVLSGPDDGQPPVPAIVRDDVAAETVDVDAEDWSSIKSRKQIANKAGSGGAASEISTDAELAEIVSPEGGTGITEKRATEVETVRNLSVEPGARSLLPDDRPKWVGAPPDLSANQHYLYVGSIPTSNLAQVDAALNEALVAAVSSYIEEEVVLHLGAAATMPIDSDFIRKNLIDDPDGYVAELSTSDGPMYQKWVTVRVTPEQREVFHKWHKQATQRQRLGALGALLSLLVGGVALTHMVLRRWYGSAKLPTVNRATATEPTLARHGSSGEVTWLWITLCGILIILSLLLFGLVGVRQTNAIPAIRVAPRPVAAPAPQAPRQLIWSGANHFEILDGARTIIVSGESHK
jgi:hypothetical protein